MTSKPSRRRLAIALLLLTWATAQAADLTVSAASSLTNAFKTLGPVFEAQHPGTTVVFNFASSDTLLAQIARGAPADVFASADHQAMDNAEAQKLLVPSSRRLFVSNALVMIVPTDSNLGLSTPADLQRAQVKHVAIGNPASVPVGRYTREALQKAQQWQAVEPKAILAQNVRQALDYVARGEVDAGFVYATDAAIMKNQIQVVATLPTETPITYPVAAIQGSPNPGAAGQFLQFLLTPAAQEVLARHGFGKP